MKSGSVCSFSTALLCCGSSVPPIPPPDPPNLEQTWHCERCLVLFTFRKYSLPSIERTGVGGARSVSSFMYPGPFWLCVGLSRQFHTDPRISRGQMKDARPVGCLLITMGHGCRWRQQQPQCPRMSPECRSQGMILTSCSLIPHSLFSLIPSHVPRLAFGFSSALKGKL